MKQTIFIDQLPPGLNGSNGLMRMHWAKYTKLKAKWSWLIQAARPKKHKGAVAITYTRCSCQKTDLDNVAASFKTVGDALVGAGIVTDDNPDIIRRLSVSWEKVSKRDQEGVRITIEDYHEK